MIPCLQTLEGLYHSPPDSILFYIKINYDILATREQQTNNATQYDKTITTMKNNNK